MTALLRTMLMIHFLRQLMLTEEQEVFGDTPRRPDYTNIDQLVRLHARAMLRLLETNWRGGYDVRIMVGDRQVGKSRRKRERVYLQTHAVSLDFGTNLYLTREGELYAPSGWYGEPSSGLGIQKTYERVDIRTVADSSNKLVHLNALVAALARVSARAEV